MAREERNRHSKPSLSALSPFSGKRQGSHADQSILATDLHYAIEHHQFEIAYQPQFRAPGLEVEGVEALLRWRHVDGRTISPSIFIPLAEEHGLVDRLSTWVLRHACIAAVSWPEQIVLAVNVIPSQFENGTLVASVEAALHESGLAADRLHLEITESSLMPSTRTALKQVGSLRDIGVGIVIDDFGTGYSALSYLSSIPACKVKIDKSFVGKMHDSAADHTIVAAIIRLCSELGIACLAEGVETEQQLADLVSLGCTELQGFLLSKPLPGPEVLPFLSAKSCDPRPQQITTAAGRGITTIQQEDTHICFEQIVTTANDIVIVTSTELDKPGPSILYVNEAFTRLTGYLPQEVIGRSPRLLQGPGTSREALDRIAAGLRAELTVSEKVLNYAKNGSPYWLDLRIVPMRNPDGRVTRYVAIQRDVTLDKRRFDELQTAADRDNLTGIPNRRALLASLQREMAARDHLSNTGLYLAYVDVDRFKGINDTFGHAAGDALLFGIADRLVENVRRVDCVGRIGGDEFAVCMPSITEDDALSTGERLRKSVASRPFQTPAGPLHVSISVGVSAAWRDDRDGLSLMERADQAMYADKRAGRDRVMTSG